VRERMNADQSISNVTHLHFACILAIKSDARQRTRKTAINAGIESAGNAAPSLMASLYAKFTFIYRESKLIFRIEDVKLPQCAQR
jgi:hypothetical protein